jgi:hypothetical protein
MTALLIGASIVAAAGIVLTVLLDAAYRSAFGPNGDGRRQ